MKRLLLATICAVGLLAPAVAQTIVPGQLSGNECWNAGQGPGGPSTGFLCTFMLNSTQTVTATAGATSFTLTNQQSDIIFTAQPAAITITLPAAPYNGQIVEFINGTVSNFVTNVITVQPNTGQTLVGGNITLTTLAAGASRELRYVSSTTSWYPVR
jgi:hypothetical protein